MNFDIFRKIPIFEELTDNEINSILDIAKRATFEKGEVIFKEGEPGDGFYILIKGNVRITTEIEDAGEELLAELKGNVHFGEINIVDGKPRSADAIAENDVICLFFPRNDFLKLMATNKDLEIKICHGFMKEFATRLRATDQKVKDIIKILKSKS